MAKKMIRPLRSEADYGAALKEIERYFEHESKPGTSEADRSVSSHWSSRIMRRSGG